MKTVLGILILAVVALVGYRKSFTQISSFGNVSFYLTGTEFILVGLLLGDLFLGVLDRPTLRVLNPVLILGLGWIGLLTGIQLEWNHLRHFPRSSFLMILSYGVCFVSILGGILFVMFRAWFTDNALCLASVAALTVTALCSGQTSMALRVRGASLESRSLGRFLQFVSSMNDVVAIVFFAALVCFVETPEGWSFYPVPAWQRALFSAMLGLLMGILFLLLFRTRLDESARVIVIIGLLLFGGGMCYLLVISPLFVYLLAGMVVANFSLRSDETFQLLARIEKPLYLVFLIVGGACLSVTSFVPLLLALLYCVLRACVHGAAGGLFLSPIATNFGLPRHRLRLGWGLLSQGGLTVALAIQYLLWFSGPDLSSLESITFTILLLAVLFNEFLSPFGLAYAVREE